MRVWSKIRGTVMAVAAVLNFASNSEVCYNEEGIGCFSNNAPFNNAKGLLPDSPDEIRVRFILYTRDNRYSQQEVTYDSINQSHYRGTNPTKFIIHGYRDDCSQSWVHRIKGALLDTGDFNVICVDWEKGADQINYNKAVANTRVVGALLDKFIKKLKEVAGAKSSHMHLIGHSLGAHISGYAGKLEKTLARITGLDPAGPGFKSKESSVRLDKSDAIFVDVIHTDGEPLTELGMGLDTAIGDADFYPNGGKDQPGCKKVGPHLFKLITGKFKDFIKGVGCDHARSRNLFIESIKSSCKFRAFPCKDMDSFQNGECNTCIGVCPQMGYAADLIPVAGTFYLSTNSISPLCKT